MISAVIPTWNEEAWLPDLLRELSQSPFVNQIIIADNNSLDHSIDIAEAFGCEVVNGGRPAYGRNSGASRASEEIILFVDADTIVDSEMLRKLLYAMQDRRVVAAHPLLVPTTSDPFVLFLYRVMDQYLRFAKWWGVTQGVGSIIAVRRSAFFAVGGFDVGLTVGEDADFFRRVSNFGWVVYDRSTTAYVSSRRFKLENKYFFAIKCMVWGTLRFFGSAKCPWGYRWEKYPLSAVRTEAIDRQRVTALSGAFHGQFRTRRSKN